jgi:S1-C subfamily serine protease
MADWRNVDDRGWRPADDVDDGPPTEAVDLVGGAPPRRASHMRPSPAARPDPVPVPGPAPTPPPPPPSKPRLRHRVLPRTVLGISAMILAFSVGAALSGTVLYSYYQYHLDQTDTRVNALIDGYRSQFQRAEGDLSAAVAQGKTAINAALAPVQTADTPATETALVRRLAPSLFFVTTENADGQPSVGSAFVVASNTTQTLLLTSYTTVAAATTTPGPQVFVRQGAAGPQTAVSVRTWDATLDLALIVLPTGGYTPIPVAPADPAPRLGQPVFALAGLGSAGAAIAAGQIDDVSAGGVANDIPLGEAFQGGPIVDTSGRVIAVASRTYAPYGFTAGGVWYAPFVDTACQQVLNCPGGHLSASS